MLRMGYILLDFLGKDRLPPQHYVVLEQMLGMWLESCLKCCNSNALFGYACVMMLRGNKVLGFHVN